MGKCVGEVTVKINFDMSFWKVVKWRLMGLHKITANKTEHITIEDSSGESVKGQE